MALTYTSHSESPLKLRLKNLQDRFENDPAFQIVFNKFFTYFWVMNFIVATTIFFGAKSLWDSYSVYYLVAISLFANFATNYGALSASESSEAAQKAAEHAAVIRNDHPDITSVGM